MKKQLSAIVKRIFVMGLSILMILPVIAQREKGEGIITQDEVRQITELVKPLKDQLEKQLTGNPTYNAYIDDLKKLQTSNSIKEKSSLTAQMIKKYSNFFKEQWSILRVDEQGYQSKIRRVFPSDLAGLLQFDTFLNFSLITPDNIRNALSETPALDKCLDICSMAKGEIIKSSVLVSGAGGSFGNCYLRTNAWAYPSNSTVVSTSTANGYLRNGITIPGSFVDDARHLRVKKSFDLKQEATCFAALGGGYTETRVQTFQTNEWLVVYAPFIWGEHVDKTKTITENYSLLKKTVSLSAFWSLSKTFSIVDSGNWSYTDCNNIKWTICEEK